jgi:patatin-like phospholipase/acyl hydrolase
MSDTIRILSIDGGGIRGIIPAMVLQALLGKLKAQDVFHIIAGTSTGGIIACGLAKPNPVEPEQIVNLYVQHGSEIFKKSIWDPIHYVYGPKYNSTALESYLASVLGDVSLSAVENVQLLVPSYAILLPKEDPPGNMCAPMFFRSWQARGLLVPAGANAAEYDFKLASIARATSAAPTYFAPARITNRAGQSFTMIDGGVFANNPTMCAIVEAHHLYHTPNHTVNVMVVSLGTGSNPIRIDAAAAMRWGDLSWAVPIISIFQDGSAQTVAFETDELIDDFHWRFDVSLKTKTPQGEVVNSAIDDASPQNIKALVNKAKQLIADQHDRIEEVAKVLAQPKAKFQPQNRMPPKGMMMSRGRDAGV